MEVTVSLDPDVVTLETTHRFLNVSQPAEFTHNKQAIYVPGCMRPVAAELIPRPIHVAGHLIEVLTRKGLVRALDFDNRQATTGANAQNIHASLFRRILPGLLAVTTKQVRVRRLTVCLGPLWVQQP